MSGLENLFATEPTLPNVQTIKMPDDANEWSEVLTTRLRELYPDVARLPLSIEFKKQDRSTGTAVGAIHVVSDESKKSILVPFVIKKFQLSPLDVWMEKDTQKVHLLNVDTFKEQFFVTKGDDGLDDRLADSAGRYFNDPSTWNTNYPPLQGRYSYASAGYTVLDNVSDAIAKDQHDRFKENLAKEAASLAGFKRNNNFEIIQKLAAKKSLVNTSDFVASAMKLIPNTVYHISRAGGDKYSILSSADKVFDLSASQPMDRESCLNFLSKITGKPQDALTEVDQEGEKMVVMPSVPKSNVFLFDLEQPAATECKEFGAYSVKGRGGVTIEGVVFPFVVGLNSKRMNMKIFASKSASAFQPAIAGVALPDSTALEKVLKPSDVRVGQTGTFVFVDDGAAIATEPVTIKAVEKYSGPITAVRLNGEKIKISMGYSASIPSVSDEKKSKKVKVLDVHGLIEQAPDKYVIPSKMVWIPLEDPTLVSATADEWMAKEASFKMELDPIVLRWTGIEFQVDGHQEFNKVAMSEAATKVLLAAKGAELNKIAGILKHAKTHGKISVHGLKRMAKKADIIKEATETRARLESLVSPLQNLSEGSIKLAANFEDPATVDSLLSLNFINVDNIAKFVAYAPLFKKVQDYLAECIIASRLGIKDINESACVSAAAKIQDVTEGLERLETVLKKPKQKIA